MVSKSLYQNLLPVWVIFHYLVEPYKTESSSPEIYLVAFSGSRISVRVIAHDHCLPFAEPAPLTQLHASALMNTYMHRNVT